MRNDEQAATRAAATLFAEPEAEGETVEEQGAGEAAPEGTEETTEEPLFPEFEPELPDDLNLELEEPSPEDILRDLENDEEYQLLDEDSQKLLQRAKAAEAKAKYYEDLRVQEAKKAWVTEAEKFFPLSAPFLASINATSRKGFLREAQAHHKAVLPLIKPLKEKAEAELAAAKTAAVEEAREEAKKRWGGAPSNEQPTEGVISQEDLTRNRAKGDLTSTLKAMMFPKRGGGDDE